MTAMPDDNDSTMSPQPSAPHAPKARRRLHESIVDAIIEDVLLDGLPAGSTLPPDPILSARFDVSRTVIREAIQALAGMGVVDVRHGAGTYVNDRDQWDFLNPQLLRMIGKTGTISILIDDLLDIRRMFEVEAVMLAARRATTEDIDALDALVRAMGHPGTSDADYAELNLEFHSMIVHASHNRILRNLREQLRGLLSVMMNARQRQADHDQGMRIVSTTMHRMLVDAIRERRPDRAQAVMLAHVQGAERSLQIPG